MSGKIERCQDHFQKSQNSVAHITTNVKNLPQNSHFLSRVGPLVGINMLEQSRQEKDEQGRDISYLKNKLRKAATIQIQHKYFVDVRSI